PAARRWRDYEVIINAAAYTGVDAAETAAGRLAAWAVNATGVARLARVAAENQLTLVHVSSDYVFDGTATRPYREDDPVSPLGVYAQSKAAGDAAVSAAGRHYLLRSSWVVGDGSNFVRTMASLAERGIDPRVVGDQVGRPTVTTDLAAAVVHLLDRLAPYGTYNLTCTGEPLTWAELARWVFDRTGHDPARITEVSTAEYAAGVSGPFAPRPANSVLDLTKITATGFTPRDAATALGEYLDQEALRPPGQEAPRPPGQ